MSRKKDIDLDLTGFAELFMNDEGRAESRLPRIYDIPLSEIDDFPNHPFKVKMDEDCAERERARYYHAGYASSERRWPV